MVPENDKREKILAAAAFLIARDGLQLSMSELARQAGVAVGSIYVYFPSKEAIIAASYARLQERLVQVLLVAHDAELTPEMRIRNHIRRYVDVIADNPDLAVLFEYLSSVPQLPTGKLYSHFQTIVVYTQRLVTEAQTAGVLMDCNPKDLDAAMGGAIRNMLKWRRAMDRRPDAAERGAIVDMVWRMVRA